MNTKLIDHQDHPGVGAPPQDGLRLAVPRENSFGISLPKSLGAQVIARGEQARRATFGAPSIRGVRQRLVFLYPRKGWVSDALQNVRVFVLMWVQLRGLGKFKCSSFEIFIKNSLSPHCICIFRELLQKKIGLQVLQPINFYFDSRLSMLGRDLV